MYLFRNFYNGGGVAIGDVNGDQRPDIFLTGNMVSNRLYLNRGDFKFEDVTKESGLETDGYWSTGASMADVNGDGLLDIFVTLSGKPEGDRRHNRLYINEMVRKENGEVEVRFSEQSEEYGLKDEALSTHGVFFDYDSDGYLDLYLLSNSINELGGFGGATGELREVPDSLGSSKLYRNNGSRFTDVTEEAGIYNSVIGFGLSASVSDLNRDGLPDLYVANDFFERDYLYINNGNGSFSEILPEKIRSMSFSSMGSDIADLNRDGWSDIYVADMLPATEERLKSKMTIESWEEYRDKVERGFHHKFTRNTLQYSRGSDTFSEIGRYSGVYATDWSWGPLIADYDLSGESDIYVTNGIYKDLLDQDYIETVSNPREMSRFMEASENGLIMSLMDQMSSEPVSNVMFENQGDFTFEEVAEEWGLGGAGFSSGAAWGDLDGDGDLDLVVNDVNSPARIYRNRAAQRYPDRGRLRVDLQGEAPNTYGIGAQLQVWSGGRQWYREHFLQRGFQSSMEPGLFVGLGQAMRVDSLVLRWPDGRTSRMSDIDLPARLTLRQSEAQQRPAPVPPAPRLPGDDPALNGQVSEPLLSQTTAAGLSEWSHRRYDYVDFNRERLLMHMRSTEGPALCSGDINGDGLEDLYTGGARDQAGRLWVQQPGGGFTSWQPRVLEGDALSEDIDCAFFDATGNGADDLYVVSGGNSFSSSASALADRLYLNDGQGRLRKSPQILPTRRGFESGSVVAVHDFTGDGLEDLFVGIRLRPFAVGMPVNGYLLASNGDGTFEDVTEQWAPQLLGAGMITDGLWADLTGDGQAELVIAGEWMPVRVFARRGNGFEEISGELGLDGTEGWWNELAAGDLDGDGDTDLVGANHGLNTMFRASDQQPVRMWVGDFSGNGMLEQILAVPGEGGDYPLALRHDLLEEVPSLEERYPDYASYAGQRIGQIFSGEQLDQARLNEARMMESMVFWNRQGSLQAEPLPMRAQLAPMYGVMAEDLTGDGAAELIMGGNLYDVKPQVGPYDASRGVVLGWDGEKLASYLPQASGVNLTGEIRDVQQVTINGEPHILIARFDGTISIYEIGTFAVNENQK